MYLKKENLYVPRGWYSRGYLPHFDGGEIVQFVTFRLFDSVPHSVVETWKHELKREEKVEARKLLHHRIESYLDQGYGSCYLRDKRIAGLVQDALLHFDGARYRLAAWVVMPNHVHMLLTPLLRHELARIIHSLKSFTSQNANKVLKRSGACWQPEYYDRYIRDGDHYTKALAYIENNPVKARLSQSPHDWLYGSAWYKKHADDTLALHLRW
jgi:REP element-mobilizing transposase RayT